MKPIQHNLRFFPLLILLISVIGFSSCRKYDEGPGLSVRTKTNRLKGVWNVEYVFRDGIEQINASNYMESFVVHTNDNLFSYTYFDGYGYIQEIGHWDFTNRREEIRLRYYEPGSTDVIWINNWVIKRLTNNQLIVEYWDFGRLIRLELRKQ